MTDGKLAAIDAVNRATLAAIGRGHADPAQHPYFGYFSVDLFDCPPFVMFTNNDSPAAEAILYHRRFEPRSMALWCARARTATSIIDIGASVGIYSLAAAALRRDLPIYAFEPNPYAAARLRVHKHINGFHNIAENHMALGNKNKIGTMASRIKPGGAIPSGGELGLFEGVGAAAERSAVIVGALDALEISPGGRCLIKIDVEGAELPVFQGMQTLLQSRPDIILESFRQDACDGINAMVLPLGYSVLLIDEDSGRLEIQDRLVPRRRDDRSFNQFLTVRPV